MANVLYSTRIIPVEHVTIRSTKSFEDVRAKLATLAPRIKHAGVSRVGGMSAAHHFRSA